MKRLDRVVDALIAQKSYAEERRVDCIKIAAIHQGFVDEAKKNIMDSDELITQINYLIKTHTADYDMMDIEIQKRRDELGEERVKKDALMKAAKEADDE